MLWMKAWLETRWRLLYAAGLPLAMLLLQLASGGLASMKAVNMAMFVISMFLVFAAVYLAGAGIRTQSGIQALPGLHGSTYYTLSLPVSRLHLLAMRTMCGLLELAAINLIILVSAWSMSAAMRAHSTPFDLLQLVFSATVCTAGFYFVSVLLAAFLSETGQIFGSFLLLGLLWLSMNRLGLPSSLNPFSFGGDASPLVTHVLPCGAMAVSVAASVILFFAAWKIIEAREY
ncbi:MAG TPA: hypothetical protein VHZ55_01245 [Bryobacteraceae bacterium]|jgi:hypothetical protein|nr:hypothetical protein [Bryobacteraceae bacterium]